MTERRRTNPAGEARASDATEASVYLEGAGGHLRVLGPPGSGKTGLLIEGYRNAGRAAVVTYSRERRGALAAALLEKGSARFGRTPVYNYHELAAGIIAAGGGRFRLAGELEEMVVLRRVLRAAEPELTSDFRNTLHSRAFQVRVLGFVNAMLQHGVGTEYRDRLMDTSHSPRVSDLFAIYFQYCSHLDSRGVCTYYDEAWRASHLVSDNPDLNPLRGVDVVLVDNFNDVDGGQYALLRALVPPDGDKILWVFGDPTGARFRNRGTTDRYLLEHFPRHYHPRDLRLAAVCPDDRVLGAVVDDLLVNTVGTEEAGVYAPGRRAEVGAGSAVETTLTVAEDEVAEASHVAGRAADLIRSGQFRPEDVSVVVRNKGLYEPAMTAAFRDRGLVLDAGKRRQHPFEFYVASLLRLLDEPGNSFVTNSLSNSPYFGAMVGGVRREGAEGGPGGEDPAGGGDTTVDSLREAISKEVVDRNGEFDLEPLLEGWLRPLVAGAGNGDEAELLAFLGRLVEEWQTYTGAVAAAGGRKTVREFLSLSGALSPQPPGARWGADRVGLFSVHEFSARRSAAVIVAGCSELIFPAVPAREDYIPWESIQSAVRRAVTDRPVEFFEARSGADFLRDEYALIWTALSRARQRLELTAPKQFAGHATPAPARVLKSIPSGARTDGVGRNPPIALRFARTIAAAGAPVPTGNRVADRWHRPPPEDRAIPREHDRLSPSSLTTFTLCSRMYYYSRLLRVEGAPSPAAAFGTAFHDLLNRLSSENRTHEQLNAAMRSSRLDELIEAAVAGTEALAAASEMERASARHHLREMALRFNELDGARRDRYRVESCEHYIRFEHGGSRFHGVADRIDRTEDGGRVVIDYKTGRLPRTGKTIRKKALAGFPKPEERLWQVPLYTRGAAPEGGGYPQTFCYYLIRPDGDDAVVGLAVGGESDAEAVAEAFGVAKSRIAHISPAELDESLDEAAVVAKEVLAERGHFERTDDRDRCTRCDFRRVCERTT